MSSDGAPAKSIKPSIAFRGPQPGKEPVEAASVPLMYLATLPRYCSLDPSQENAAFCSHGVGSNPLVVGSGVGLMTRSHSFSVAFRTRKASSACDGSARTAMGRAASSCRRHGNTARTADACGIPRSPDASTPPGICSLSLYLWFPRLWKGRASSL